MTKETSEIKNKYLRILRSGRGGLIKKDWVLDLSKKPMRCIKSGLAPYIGKFLIWQQQALKYWIESLNWRIKNNLYKLIIIN